MQERMFAYRVANREKIRERDRINAKKYNQQPYRAKAIQNWQARNREKRQAHVDLGNALKLGKVVKQPCQKCGSPRSEAHHPDYSKPLEVVWLCRIHHVEEHK